MDRAKKISLYAVGLVSTLTSAGSIFVLIALSAAFLESSPGGEASSALQSLFYLGVAVTGLFGGWVLQRCSFVWVGFVGPLLSAALVVWLAYLGTLPPVVGLACAFAMYLLAGIDHPNNIRFYREVLSGREAARFFSLVQGVSTMVSFGAPLAAGYLVNSVGYQASLKVGACVYVTSALPWLVVWGLFPRSGRSVERLGMFVGFRALFRQKALLRLNTARVLNNLAYVSWMTALPVVLARYAAGDTHLYARALGWGNAIFCAVFAATSIGFAALFRRRLPLVFMSWAAPLFGLVAVLCLLGGFISVYFVFGSAILIGVGTYCFRISGMTVGQIITPKSLLASVVVAGDTTVRMWSFLVSTLVVSFGSFGNAMFVVSVGTLAFLALGALIFMPALARESEAVSQESSG